MNACEPAPSKSGRISTDLTIPAIQGETSAVFYAQYGWCWICLSVVYCRSRWVSCRASAL